MQESTHDMDHYDLDHSKLTGIMVIYIPLNFFV